MNFLYFLIFLTIINLFSWDKQSDYNIRTRLHNYEKYDNGKYYVYHEVRMI